MKIFIITCFLSNLDCSSYGNPSSPPSGISEIFFNSTGEWFIELDGGWDFSNLDNVRITGLYDTAQFLPGINVVGVLTITQDDFITPLYINRLGDLLNLESWDGNTWYVWGYGGSIAFGDLPDPYQSEVSAPVGEESIAQISGLNIPWGRWYMPVKELPNSLGYNPFQVVKREEFSGYVRNINGSPLSNITLQDGWSFSVTTDVSGYFYAGNLYCKKYTVTFESPQGNPTDSRMIILEPDSANYFEFVLDSTFFAIKDIRPSREFFSIQNFPNPFSNQTIFAIETTGKMKPQKGVIKIYTNESYIVDILPVELTGDKQEVVYNLSAQPLPSGVYYYSLEIAQERKASGKMVISK